MRIVLVSNGASGRGGAGAIASEASATLRARGHAVEQIALSRSWAGALDGAGLIIACGGDGTVSAVAPEASRRDIPIFHLPRGTENLFAREFGMRPSAALLASAVEAWRVEAFDLGRVESDADPTGSDARHFALMCSVGFDADVLRALAARRRGPISHASYVVPVVRSLLAPVIRTLWIEVDGRVVVDGVKGNVVVSNCRRYALGIDPSREASMTDGELDVFFAPSASSARTLAWMASALAFRGVRSGRAVRARGRTIRVRVEGDDRLGFQADGESLHATGARELTFTLAPEKLRVLRPA